MNGERKTLVYLILGAAGSGRRTVLADLIEGGLDSADRAAVMLSAGERDDAEPAAKPASARVSHWQWDDGMIIGQLPADATHVFFVADGTRNPVDQIEV